MIREAFLLTGTFQHSPAPAEVASARIETIERYGGVEIDIWCLGSDTAKLDYAAFWAPWIPALKKFLAKTDDAMASLTTHDAAAPLGSLGAPELKRAKQVSEYESASPVKSDDEAASLNMEDGVVAPLPHNLSAPHHLRYMSVYDQVGFLHEQHQWVNVISGDGADLVDMTRAQAEWPQAGLRGWPQPDRSIFGKEAKEGGELPPGWRANVSAFVQTILPAVLNGSVTGAFLGDELVCSGIPRDNFDNVSTELKRQMLAAIGGKDLSFSLYANECEPVFDDPHYPRNRPMLVPALDFVSVDIYDSNGTVEVDVVKSFLGNHIFPKLHPHQKVFLVPGVFGDDPQDCRQHSSDAKSCATVEEQDAESAKKLALYWEWATHEPLIAGFNVSVKLVRHCFAPFEHMQSLADGGAACSLGTTDSGRRCRQATRRRTGAWARRISPRPCFG